MQHTHFSFMQALNAFISVLVIGTFWRLIYAHFMASQNPTLNFIGQAMAFQY
jgi:hypothetical protein